MVALKIAQQAMPEPGWLLGPVAVAKFCFAVKLLASLFFGTTTPGEEGRAYVKPVGMAVTCFSIVYPTWAGQGSVSGGNCYGSPVMFDCIAMGLLNFCDF